MPRVSRSTKPRAAITEATVRSRSVIRPVSPAGASTAPAAESALMRNCAPQPGTPKRKLRRPALTRTRLAHSPRRRRDPAPDRGGSAPGTNHLRSNVAPRRCAGTPRPGGATQFTVSRPRCSIPLGAFPRSERRNCWSFRTESKSGSSSRSCIAVPPLACASHRASTGTSASQATLAAPVAHTSARIGVPPDCGGPIVIRAHAEVANSSRFVSRYSGQVLLDRCKDITSNASRLLIRPRPRRNSGQGNQHRHNSKNSRSHGSSSVAGRPRSPGCHDST